MVKFDVLLLVVTIFLATPTPAPTPTVGLSRQIKQNGETHTESDAGSSTPIHRVILLVDPVKNLSDSLVINLHKKTLAEKVERTHKRNLPRPKLPGDVSTSPTFTLPGTPQGKPAADPAESISAEQLTALSDLYLLDDLTGLLTSRYRITVLDNKDVIAAIGALHLSLQQAADPDGAQKLCTHMESDAVVVIGMPVLTRNEGLTRELVMRTEVRLAALRDPNGGFTAIHKPRELPSSTGAGNAKHRLDFTVAGTAVANQSFMRAGYGANYPALSEQAAVQAAALAMHTLATGEEAPLMSAGTRIAIAPAYGPDRADMLVFSSSGRHTEIGAVRLLSTDLVDMFRPELLPIMGNDVIDAGAAAEAMRLVSMSSSGLWRDNSNPDIEAARNLGRRLKVQYLLLARVIDVEVAASPSSDGDNRTVSKQRDSTQPSDVRPWEREAHAEACGALIRVQDGAVIWTDRGDTTVTSREKVPPALRAAANRNIAADAEKFALIDLKRHFGSFRSQFER